MSVHQRLILTSLTFLSLGIIQTCLIFTLAYPERSSHLRTISKPSPNLEPSTFVGVLDPSPTQAFLWLIRFTTTFTITSFSSVLLSAIIRVRATRVLSAKRFEPSLR